MNTIQQYSDSICASASLRREFMGCQMKVTTISMKKWIKGTEVREGCPKNSKLCVFLEKKELLQNRYVVQARCKTENSA